MKALPKVSVLMPAYNHEDFVVDSIRSVLDQDFVDFEFLIGDDGSPDGTAAAVRSIEDPRITFYAHAINRGAVAVHNELIEKSCGEYIAVINSDDQ